MRTRPALIVVAGLTAGLALAGCSGDGSGSDPSKDAEAVKSAAAAKTTDVDGAFGARKELSKEKCAADKGGAWSFTGTLTNQQKSAQNYVVTASVVDGKTFTVLGRKEIKQKLDAGKSTDLKADKFVTTTKSGAQCVLRVTRKPA